MVHFIAFDPPLQKLQCVSLSKTLVSTLDQNGASILWDMRDRGIPSCNSTIIPMESTVPRSESHLAFYGKLKLTS